MDRTVRRSRTPQPITCQRSNRHRSAPLPPLKRWRAPRESPKACSRARARDERGAGGTDANRLGRVWLKIVPGGRAVVLGALHRHMRIGEGVAVSGVRRSCGRVGCTTTATCMREAVAKWCPAVTQSCLSRLHNTVYERMDPGGYAHTVTSRCHDSGPLTQTQTADGRTSRAAEGRRGVTVSPSRVSRRG